MDRPLSVTALRCRTSDRTPGASRGAEALALALDPDARLVGTFGEARIANWDDDLRDSHGCLLEAGGQVEDMLVAGAFPVLTTSDCSICMTTFQAITRHEPDARVLWLDAHGDYNTPDTTPSGFLGGMCLAASCGVWDAGFEPSIDPGRVLMSGVRDLDAGERVLVDTTGVKNVRPSEVAQRLAGQKVYVHLDLDVLDPDILPSQFAVPGGLSDTGLRTLLAEVKRECEVIGLEVTAFEYPEPANVELVESIVRAVL
ncbi:arginase family protein [Solirubrobacter sp. CPCC 204708]|uniref:Arginase family protein n=1 Tax=Solirubrobacter deserti TaxID=2282478 RepID=A0ABT4RFU9_9ACTN|nr:arginase family protein [Solirubrobacter deserti]MBE2318126.1 arginase family protein [Solirubrobacter deserti]MDA0137404.1 arginase family protein [Solirubrobacter deserti]